MQGAYIEIIAVVKTLGARAVPDLVKLELDGGGIYDINSVQALMLFKI